MISDSLRVYIESKIIPQYSNFDKGHNIPHVTKVIEESLNLAKHYNIDFNIIYVAAAYHDLGLIKNRETHHIESGRIVRIDKELLKWFSQEQIEIIAEAVEDHRASSENPPRSIYGKIIAEADRDIVPETILRRTVQYGLANYSKLSKEKHWERFVEHLNEKYAEGGYLKLWLPQSNNAKNLAQLRNIINDETRLKIFFEEIWAEEFRSQNQGTNE